MANNRKTICLNMIVKNESHIIKETLENLTSKIVFDYYVICDTGSTDNTKQIINDFFEKKGIPGELHDDEWRDFAHNRTKALEYAFEKTDYALIFDADDKLHGDFILPTNMNKDGYHLQFGNQNGTSYVRVLLIDNRIKWRYLGVLHEFIDCQKPNPNIDVIKGNYYIVSGRLGDRNKDPNKYLKDALILEKAHKEALEKNDNLYLRYAFYCANSYSDCGKYEKAIEWYKTTLKQDNWFQEKYMSCKFMYDCFVHLNRKEEGLYYLVESFRYDNERGECLYNIITEYLWKNMPNMAYNYYRNSKHYIENKYLNDTSEKLFVEVDKLQFYVPYYMIIIADKVKEYETIAKMYQIIFTKKCHVFHDHWIGNMLFNLQFFVEYCIKYIPNFFELFNNYFVFLKSHNYNYTKFKFLTKFKKYGLDIDYSQIDLSQKFSLEECKKSNKILIYTGYFEQLWNYTISLNKALGGSETAITYVSRYFPKNYDVYIAGDVKEEKVDNITYIHNKRLPEFIEENAFHTIIISRYIGFFEIYRYASSYQYYIWGHDTHLLPYGCDLNSEEIIDKYSERITGCICLTDWQKKNYEKTYPQLVNKIHLINNGIDLDLFKYDVKKKKPNKFLYSSCSERGLSIILDLWPVIIEYMPNAELIICSYNTFPKNEADHKMKKIIDSYDNIRHLGKLKREELYREMADTEYWFFPSIFPETSCITALEMLMSEVICIYYPFAGLPDTMKDYGIKMDRGNELDKLFGITLKDKITLRKNGRKYAESCSWYNRSLVWNKLLFDNEKTKLESEVKRENEVIQEKKEEHKKVEDNKVEDKKEVKKEIIELFREKEPGPNNVLLCNNPIVLNSDILNNIYGNTNTFQYNPKTRCVEIIDEKQNKINISENNNNNNNNKHDDKINISKVNSNNNSNLSNSSEKWFFYCRPCSFLYCVIDDYFDSLRTKYNIEYTEDRNVLFENKHEMITFVNEVTREIEQPNFLLLLKNTKVSYLNLEPLNLDIRMDNMIEFINLFIKNGIDFTIFDYSLSNIQILKQHQFIKSKIPMENIVHLPYITYDKETNFLANLNKNTNKTYDFGVITGCGAKNNSIDELSLKRKIVVEKLIKRGFSVNVISGWKYDRDKEIAKCKVLINIHGQLPKPNSEWQESKIFEHIRCDRLLNAGYNILSEESLHLSDDFKSKFSNNLKIITYDEFLNIDIKMLDKLWPDLFNLKEYESLKKPKKIIDCFTFYNEIDILVYRLNLLDPVVDYFVLVEATLTHVGKEKILFFDQIKDSSVFDKFRDKIIHIVVDDFPFNSSNIDVNKEQQWKNEKYQRNCIKNGIKQLSSKLVDKDLIIIADVDEIPDPNTILNLKYSHNKIEFNSLEQEFYYYNLNSYREEKWYHPKIVSYKTFNEMHANNITCDDIRFSSCKSIPFGGWHLSYFGSPDFIKNKLLNFAHQEFNKDEITNVSAIENRIKNCSDLFGRATNMRFINIEDNIYLPPYYDKYLKKYYKQAKNTKENNDDTNKLILGIDVNPNLANNNNNNNNTNKNKKYCFIHSSNVDNDLTRLNYLIQKIRTSGCHDTLEKIFINNIGIPITFVNNTDNKIEVINYSENVNLLEKCTINKIWEFSQNNPNCDILYLHTKGISYKEDHHFYKNINDWIDMMLYFLVDKHELCSKILNNNYYTIGCNYSNYFENNVEITPPHYSGNFWWAKSDYIKLLNKLSDDTNNSDKAWYKNEGEFWLLSRRYNDKYFTIHNSGIDHYKNSYKPSKYILNL